MTSENFEEILQLIKDDITKENTKTQSHSDYNFRQLAFYQQGNHTKVTFITIIFYTQHGAVQNLLLFALSSSPFFLL